MEKLTVFEALIKSLRTNPNDWGIGEHTAKHKSGLEIWTANTVLDCGIYSPVKRGFSVREKFLLKAEISKVKDQKILKILEES